MSKTTRRPESGTGLPATRRDQAGLSPRVREMVNSLHELCDAIEAGIPLEQAARVRPSPLSIKPPDLKAADVRAIRESLGLNQNRFADFLGVKLDTLRSWEKGDTAPSPLARRFLDEIRGDRDYWLEKLRRRTREATPSPQSNRMR